MHDPFDIIRRFFRRALPTPDPDTIAAPTALGALLPELTGRLTELQLIPLTDAERKLLRNKDPSHQQRMSRALLRLLRLQPQLRARTGVDLAALEAVAAKDEAHELLSGVLAELLKIVEDAELLLRASLSQRVLQVLQHVRELQADPAADPAQQREVALYCKALQRTAAKALARAGRTPKEPDEAGRG